ncbi:MULTISPECIES: DUF72 domain-containing protein [Pseudoalteromonas]|nr:MULTISPECIES: DUF72 domain-containing protein [Pseudoalteromonas]KJY88203.1 hypothetical protein TW75_12435 [Pseudoalteromonas piscicida]
MLYLGCPQWSSAHWKGRFFTTHCQSNRMLQEYGQIFNSVEGNTSFYADPKPNTIEKWRNDVPEHFRFTFKIPKRFSHEMALQNCQQGISHWLQLFEPIFDKLGMVMLQLPKACSPEHLPKIIDFCSLLPKELQLGIEVRHLGFFDKSDNERRFNQFLMANSYNRIMMDTRPLFSEPANTQAIIDAQQKKPRVPLHVIATSNSPMIRYVGCSDLEANRAFYRPWLTKINHWLDEGKTPYVFFHTADNYDAPILAKQFINDLQRKDITLGLFPAEQQPQQNSFL